MPLRSVLEVPVVPIYTTLQIIVDLRDDLCIPDPTSFYIFLLFCQEGHLAKALSADYRNQDETFLLEAGEKKIES